MVYRGHVQDGMVVLEDGARLPEGTPVIVQTTEPSSADSDSVYRLGELAVPTGVADLAANVDHHLYGHPKAHDVPS